MPEPSDSGDAPLPTVDTEPEELPPRDFLVGIGSSAGGLESLSALFSTISPDLDIPYVVVQHLSPTHRSLLAQLIGRETSMRVVEIEDQVIPEPNTVYITPANWNLIYRDRRLHLIEPVKEVSPKPSVNLFFTSLAEQKGEDAVGIILSGTGSDGASGIRAIKAAGGFTFAQEPSSARYNGMPQAAIDTDLVDFVLSPEEMAKELASIARSRGLIRLTRQEVPSSLKTLLGRARQRTKIDFSDYKETTVSRRIERRMAANHVRSLEEYLALTAERPEELDRLSKDILISVTAFFRDREPFAALRQVLTRIVRGKAEGTEIRVWVPGCATGEEAYSIAFLISDLLGPRVKRYNVQIFATDLDEDALSVARRGLYSATAVADVDPDLVSRYFTVRGDQVEVSKSVREMVLFARQDLVQDPPFLRLDLVSCRNLLIYFNATLQAQVLSTFHYALAPGGVLFLGKSESILPHQGLFEPLHKEGKLFRRGSAQVMPTLRSISAFASAREPRSPAPSRDRRPEERLLAAAAAAYLPPSLLVDGALDIQYAHGDVSGLLEFPSGRPSHNVIRAVRKELRAEVQMLIYQARQRGAPAHGTPRTLPGPGDGRTIRVSVHPAHLDEAGRPEGGGAPGRGGAERGRRSEPELFLVSFEPANARATVLTVEDIAENDQLALRTMHDELATTREHMQTLVEELETSNEEMQALNEEMQASNEELQSTNEELETANEELQSTNEELTTVNEELQVKAAQLTEANTDLENIQSSTDLPILVVDEHLRVTRFNEAAARAFTLRPSALMRSVTEVTFEPTFEDVAEKILRVIRERRTHEEQLGDLRQFVHVRISPYFTTARLVRGAVLTFLDTTSLVVAEWGLRESQDRLLAVMNNSVAVITVKDVAGRYEFVNAGFEMLTGVSAASVLGKSDEQALPPAFAEAFRERELEVIRRRQPITSEDSLPVGGKRRWYLAVRFPLFGPDQVVNAVCTQLTDITERKEIDRVKSEFISLLSHELRTPLTSIRGSLGLIAGGVAGELAPRARELVENALGNTERISRLVSDILDMERIGSGRPGFSAERQEVAPILDQALLFAEELGREHRVRFLLAEPARGAMARVDGERLGQAVENLLSNAAKFSPPGDDVLVSLARREGGMLRISVTDRGPGIPESLRGRVFERFIHTEITESRRKGGNGLGLALARAIVEAMGGKIGFHPNPQAGTTFYIDLPEVT
ncbi:chemotaxis protein CheB [Chondromyces crocatus]|uniref:Histidine kinase n=1 Tax=Chondromyces crocatus TaxID=52 RepID=A0A0K1E9T4_CHOCO|nr:chemotaxis protein CheB [Chondromyces crocatus]AKT37636.1 histidine kinase [Chondromyces crocatus]